MRVGYTYVAPDGATLARIGELIDAGWLRLNVDETFPLDGAPAAHVTGEKGHVRGLLVLDLR